MSVSSSRLFIVGNGPSLNDTDLDLLIGEESWASGRIDLMYQATGWRPTRGFWGEWPKGEKDYLSILAHLAEGYSYWIRRDAAESLLVSYEPRDIPSAPLSDWRFCLPVVYPEQVHLYDWCHRQHAGMLSVSESREIPTAWHLPELCRFGSTMHIMLQQAVLEKRNPIYIIGADLGFRPGLDNHFDPSYARRDIDLARADAFNKTHVAAHTIARDCAKARGITVFNATIGGHLEVYPRVSFPSLF